jgi:proteasome lid subunit RPN8/RPN11
VAPVEDIIIPDDCWQIMLSHVSEGAPEEACGLLGGKICEDRYQAIEAIPTVNILHSTERYQVAPQEQLQAFVHFEKQGLELVAIYHSHPRGPETPSPTDIAEAYYPETVYLIWSSQGNEWKCRGFLIQRGQVREIKIFRATLA